MKPATGIFFSALLLVLLGLTMIWSVLYRGSATAPIDEGHAPASALEIERKIPPFTLTSADEEPFDTAELEGKVWVASFFFTACPSICKQQNQQIAILQEEFADDGVQFVSITCDPDNDTPEALRQYAQAFQAQPGVWHFLTGELEEIKKITENSFLVAFDTQTHSDRLMIIDKQGKLRGAFKATDDTQFRQAKKLLKELNAESYVPGETANDGTELNVAGKQTMESFQLTDSLGQPFDSASLEGDVWLGSFFYTSCPSICVMQNMAIAQMRNEFGDRGLKVVSITCDPENDTPAALAGYAERFQADPEQWHFCTGDFAYIQKIGKEFFSIAVEEQYHSDRVFLVDREGQVLDSFRTREADQMKKLKAKLAQMLPPVAEDADTMNDTAPEVAIPETEASEPSDSETKVSEAAVPEAAAP